MEEQRQKNSEAEQLEAKAVRARREAEVAADRIQQCQSSLQAAEDRLVAKKHEISHKVGPPNTDEESILQITHVKQNRSILTSLCTTYLLCIAVSGHIWLSDVAICVTSSQPAPQ